MFEPNCVLISKKKVVEIKGEKKTFVNYYLRYENGVEVAIKPSFDNDYAKLRVKALPVD